MFVATTFTNRAIVLRKSAFCEDYFCALRTIYGQHNRPTEPTIRHTIDKIENRFTLLDDTRPNRPRPAHNATNLAEYFHDDSEESIRHCSQQLGLSYETTWQSYADILV